MIHLEPGEEVVLEVRKHWFVFFVAGLFHLFAGIFPFVVYSLIFSLVPALLPFKGGHSGLLLFFYSLWLLTLWLSFFIQWTNYYLDVWVVTKSRIIDVEQRRMFHRSVSSLRFDRIQDISVSVQGIVATYFDIGDIQVQTAAENSKDFFMKNAASPAKVRNLIFSHHNKESESAKPPVPHDSLQH